MLGLSVLTHYCLPEGFYVLLYIIAVFEKARRVGNPKRRLIYTYHSRIEFSSSLVSEDNRNHFLKDLFGFKNSLIKYHICIVKSKVN